MRNNFEIIKPFLTFPSEDHFYFCQVVLRKKDVGVKGTNNNSRMIKAYFIKSTDYLESKMNEIIKICDVTGARAMINLRHRSFKNVALRTLQLISANMINGNDDKVFKCYASACGKGGVGPKAFLVDIDKEELHLKEEIISFINSIRPFEKTNKLLIEIPSKTGVHLITCPFDKQRFKQEYPSVQVNSNSPTNLYIP